jgi:hypothetical protein
MLTHDESGDSNSVSNQHHTKILAVLILATQIHCYISITSKILVNTEYNIEYYAMGWECTDGSTRASRLINLPLLA